MRTSKLIRLGGWGASPGVLERFLDGEPAVLSGGLVTWLPRIGLNALVLLCLWAALAAGTTSAVELRDAELVAVGSPVLQNGGGTVRLEDSRLGRLGPLALVPEPGALWQLGSGIGLLALLARRCGRRRAAASQKGLP
jgi:hypothetical protein